MSRQANSDSDAMLSHDIIKMATDIYLAGG